MIIVTGAAGFIGSKLASTLLEENIKVVGIDNLNTYYDTRLKEHRLQFLKQNPNFEFYKIDIEVIDNIFFVADKCRMFLLLNLYNQVALAASEFALISFTSPESYRQIPPTRSAPKWLS